MGVVRLSNAGIRDFQKVDNFLAGNTAFEPDDEDFLEEVVLTSSASSVTFDNLDTYSDYKHLQIRATLRGDVGFDFTFVDLQFNNDTTSSYAYHRLRGQSGSVISNASTGRSNAPFGYLAGSSATANVYSSVVCDILDFSSSSKNTTIRALTGFDNTSVALFSGGFFKTGAVTEIDIIPDGGTNFVTGSRFSLYGSK